MVYFVCGYTLLSSHIYSSLSMYLSISLFIALSLFISLFISLSIYLSLSLSLSLHLLINCCSIVKPPITQDTSAAMVHVEDEGVETFETFDSTLDGTFSRDRDWCVICDSLYISLLLLLYFDSSST